jgi:hypothetical protein
MICCCGKLFCNIFRTKLQRAFRFLTKDSCAPSDAPLSCRREFAVRSGLITAGWYVMCVASALRQYQCPDRAAARQCNRKVRVLPPRGTGVAMRLVGVGAGGASERAGSAYGGATSARPTRGARTWGRLRCCRACMHRHTEAHRDTHTHTQTQTQTQTDRHTLTRGLLCAKHLAWDREQA